MFVENMIKGLLATLLSLLGFVLAVWPNLKLIPNLGIAARIGRALMTGLGFLFFSISGTVALDYLGSPNIERNWDIKALSGSFCFGLPVSLLLMIGSFIWYSRRIGTQRHFSTKLDKIIQNSKKSK
jgi:hypothetical protein